jgi:hypothetical protein
MQKQLYNFTNWQDAVSWKQVDNNDKSVLCRYVYIKVVTE